jgi:hypothetical protein
MPFIGTRGTAVPSKTRSDDLQSTLLDAVDRAFDLAEQTLAAQRQLTLTLIGAVDRQVDTAVDAVESGARQALAVADEVLEVEQEWPQPAARPEADKAKARKPNGGQEAKVDRRPFEDRSVEELRDRARELDIEGRSNMSKDELVAALRKSGR